VAVVGIGGVGVNLVQIAAAAGAAVIAIDTNRERLEVAKRFGAQSTVSPDDGPAGEQVRKLTAGGVDVAFEAVGKAVTSPSSPSTLRRGGRLCVVGFSPESPQWAASKVMFHEMEILARLGCRPVDYPPLIAMVAARLQLSWSPAASCWSGSRKPLIAAGGASVCGTSSCLREASDQVDDVDRF
jgi:threonine dehydrogenase-like Zn-dependent dehydrogenase